MYYAGLLVFQYTAKTLLALFGRRFVAIAIPWYTVVHVYEPVRLKSALLKVAGKPVA